MTIHSFNAIFLLLPKYNFWVLFTTLKPTNWTETFNIDLIVLCLHGWNVQGSSEARLAHRNSSDWDMALQIIFKPLKNNSLSHHKSCGVFRLRSICDPATCSGVIISQLRITPDHSANYQSTNQKTIIILCPSFHPIIYNATWDGIKKKKKMEWRNCPQ